MGSTEAARCAGSHDAASASNNTNTAAVVSASGSKALMPNRKEVRSRDAAIVPTSPIAQPAIASLAAEANTRLNIPERCEPSATRMAISCTRRAAEKAMTL